MEKALAVDSLWAVETSHFASFVVALYAEASEVPSLPYSVPVATEFLLPAGNYSLSFPAAYIAVRAKTLPGIPDSYPFGVLEVFGNMEALAESFAASAFDVARSFDVAVVAEVSVVVAAAGVACTSSCYQRPPVGEILRNY